MRSPLRESARIPSSTFRCWRRAFRLTRKVDVARDQHVRSIRDLEVAEVYLEALGQLKLFPTARWRDERYVYAVVPSRLVRRRVVAEAARRWAARDLGIAPPPMDFFVRIELAAACGATQVAFVHDEIVRGRSDADTGCISIDVTLPARKMVEVVAHEVKHIALGNPLAKVALPPDWQARMIRMDETEAYRYGLRVAHGPAARRAGLVRRRPNSGFRRIRSAGSTEPSAGSRGASMGL